VSLALELRAQLGMVIDFAIENDADGTVLVPHWLLAALEIDDGEAAETQKDPLLLVDVESLVVGPAMRQRPRHGHEVFAVTISEKTGYPAHGRFKSGAACRS
jgi:hypothetical protein